MLFGDVIAIALTVLAVLLSFQGLWLLSDALWPARTRAARNRVETMDFANSITRIAADLSADFQTDVPIAVVMLDYYGRQLELGIATGRQATLTQATADLRQQWDRVQPTIERRGHVDAARRFTDIVVQLEGARRPADFVAPTRAELEAVDRLELIFKPNQA